jgi:hypothetical protein
MNRLLLATGAVFLAVLAPAFAQSLPEKTGVNTAMGIAPKTQDFVTEAAQSDMLEIASSKLALTKSDSDKSKQFADRMIKDHTATSNELKGLVSAGKTTVNLPAAMDKAHRSRSTGWPSSMARTSPGTTTTCSSRPIRTPCPCSNATARAATMPTSRPSRARPCRISSSI